MPTPRRIELEEDVLVLPECLLLQRRADDNADEATVRGGGGLRLHRRRDLTPVDLLQELRDALRCHPLRVGEPLSRARGALHNDRREGPDAEHVVDGLPVHLRVDVHKGVPADEILRHLHHHGPDLGLHLFDAALAVVHRVQGPDQRLLVVDGPRRLVHEPEERQLIGLEKVRDRRLAVDARGLDGILVPVLDDERRAARRPLDEVPRAIFAVSLSRPSETVAQVRRIQNDVRDRARRLGLLALDHGRSRHHFHPGHDALRRARPGIVGALPVLEPQQLGVRLDIVLFRDLLALGAIQLR
mmetsp:Transcript_100933/g.282925  ORF Transcript_100933/g.282925 Transcript_100933/m.282925 type:complete len:300 (-) Transcript_100933:320-1219(-)